MFSRPLRFGQLQHQSPATIRLGLPQKLTAEQLRAANIQLLEATRQQIGILSNQPDAPIIAEQLPAQLAGVQGAILLPPAPPLTSQLDRSRLKAGCVQQAFNRYLATPQVVTPEGTAMFVRAMQSHTK
jgi:hypothetical protein